MSTIASRAAGSGLTFPKSTTRAFPGQGRGGLARGIARVEGRGVEGGPLSSELIRMLAVADEVEPLPRVTRGELRSARTSRSQALLS